MSLHNVAPTPQGQAFGAGAGLPSDGDDHYAPNALFCDTDATAGEGLYVNCGSVTSCNFDRVAVTSVDNTFSGANTFTANVRLTGAATTFHMGSHSNEAGSGTALDGTTTAAARIYSDEGGSDNSGNQRGLLVRHLTETDQTGNQTRSAIQAQVKINDADVDDNSHWQGLYGYLEVDGEATLGDGTDAGYFAAVRGAVEFASGATVTVSDNSYATAFRAEYDDAASATESGTIGAYMIATPANGNFGNAFVFESAGASYPCGIKAVTKTPTGNTTHAIKIDIANGTSGYIPVYNDENFNADD